LIQQSKLQGSVQVRVTEDVTLHNLQDIVAAICRFGGCPTCGIMGIDLRLSGESVEFRELAEVPGVKSISKPQPFAL
jgi:hypothetical protein